MNKIILDLFTALWQKKINQQQFFVEFHEKTGSKLTEELCLAQINEAIKKKDSEAIDLFVQIGFMITFTKESLATMCSLLQIPYHHKHEDIAMLLKEFADFSTVDCIFEATERKFEYLDYDDTYQFARKCIKALAAIGDPNAILKLKVLSNSKIEQISNYAKKELQ